jgi:hypothetical protein
MRLSPVKRNRLMTDTYFLAIMGDDGKEGFSAAFDLYLTIRGQATVTQTPSVIIKLTITELQSKPSLESFSCTLSNNLLQPSPPILLGTGL